MAKTEFAHVRDLDAKYYMKTFNRNQLCITHGKGCKLYDTAGNEYTDFFGGIAVSCLGYAHPRLTAAIAEQAERLIHISNLYYTREQAELSELLLKNTDFDRVFFCNSGAEANEGAIKLARRYFYNQNKTGRILSAQNSFHGRTLATLTATGQEKYSQPFAPLPGGFTHIPFNDISALKDELNKGDVIALMLETVQGESGVRPAAYDYLVTAYALCRAKGVLLILDEVQTGMGRCGSLFSYEQYGIKPDIITLAKGIAGGVPMGAVLARGAVAEAFMPGDHGSTFGGNPLACAAATVVVKLLREEGLIAEVAEKGEYLMNKLAVLKRHNFVKDIRGRGLLIGIELDGRVKNAEIAGLMLKSGYIVNPCGGNTIRLAPPYIISKEEIDGMAAALNKIFSETNV